MNVINCLSPGGRRTKWKAGMGSSPLMILSTRQHSMVLLSESITVKKNKPMTWWITIVLYCRDVLEPGVEVTNVLSTLKAFAVSIFSFVCFYNGVISIAVRDKKIFFVTK